MNVFITGGHGFIGSVVVRKLLTAGHAVRCLVRPTSNTARIDGLAVERVTGDVHDAGVVRNGLEGCQAAIHLAGPSAWSEINDPDMQRIAARGLAHVLDAARAAGSARVVFASSVVAVGAADTPTVLDEAAPYTLDATKALGHSHQKHRGEAACRQAAADGQDVVIVNPAEVYGPNDTELVTAGNLVDFARGNPVLVCRGGTSVVHVEDVADGIVAALERGRTGERYILGGENVTLRQLAELVLAALGRRRTVVTIPNPLLRAITHAATRLRISLPFNPDVVPYATRYWYVDSSKARRELGVSFRPARETIQSTVAWLQQAGHIA
jgi:dihydroflavonol-4-reductase